MGIGDMVSPVLKDEMSIIFILDNSGSMTIHNRIGQLNNALPEAIKAAEAAGLKYEINVQIRIIVFNSSPKWVIGTKEAGVSPQEAISQWTDLGVTGGTDTAAALRLAKEAMHTEYLGTTAYKPYVILITDGESNDYSETKKAIDELAGALRKKSDASVGVIERIALGVEDANMTELEAFATKGTINDENGTRENAPLVFDIRDVATLSDVLKAIVVSSITSSVTTGTPGNGGGDVIINVEPKSKSQETEDWED